MGQGERRPGEGGAEGAAVEVLEVLSSTQAVDAPGTNSDKFLQLEGRINGASDSVHPQSGGRSCCAVDSTGAVLVQVQLLDCSRCPCCAGH